MDYYRQKYRDGLIDIKTFERFIEIINHLEEKGYTFKEVIGDGSYGSVIKVKQATTSEEFAAKIVRKDYASDSEVNLWKNLSHDHVLRLIDVQYVYYADSYIFLMPLYSKNLEQVILDPSFKSSKNALQQTINWLKQILDATAYLHDNSLSHNDIKSNNILIKDNNKAILADFGFLASTETKINRYGAPFIYRCPEGRVNECGLTEIKGKKLDVWTIGTLAFELFSGMFLLKEFSKWEGPLSCWFTDVYPMLQNSLQKKHFQKLIQDAYPSSNGINETVDDVIDFITSCLNIVPENRPSIHELQNHKLFGGTYERTEPDKDVDIWKKIMNLPKFNSILKENDMATVPGRQINYSYHSECSEIYVHDTYVVKADSAVIQPIELERLDDADAEEKIPSVSQSSHHRSLNTPVQQEAPNLNYIFDSPSNSETFDSPSLPTVSQEIIDIHAVTGKPSSDLQRFRKWWRHQKYGITKLFTACCSCAKQSSTKD